MIVRSVNENKEKWLIFIDDKEKCEDVKKRLEEYGTEIGYPMKIEVKSPEKKSEMKDMIFAVDAGSKKIMTISR